MEEELDRQLRDYRVFLKVEKNYRPSTIRGYEGYLKAFLRYVEVLLPTEDNVMEFRARLIEMDRSPSTVVHWRYKRPTALTISQPITPS